MDADELPLTLYQATLPGLLREMIPSTARSQHCRRRIASDVWARRLDRVNVLSGHLGCVNALSWARNGELLISSGDDRQLRVWRMDQSDMGNEYPFACQAVIHTGHGANVFNAHMLPSSTRIATVAGDSQVRVFDIGESAARSPTGCEMVYFTGQACIRVLRCHSQRTKRIITEDSPDIFLTVAEDGEVRQHDLRTSHTCRRGVCPAPLVRLPHELSTIALSPLTPYQFVVGGESPFAHLFDRRHIGRYLQEEWGMSPTVDDVTTCVRRFSRHSRAPGEAKGHEHITGAKMSGWNGHELLLSFNSDGVYLYSTRDEPGENSAHKSCILPPNMQRTKQSKAEPPSRTHNDRRDDEEMQQVFGEIEEDDEEGMETGDSLNDIEDNEEPWSDDDEGTEARIDMHHDISVVYPRMRFSGHCNVETVKDVNYLGPYDEYVTSGSDDGNFFIWKKSSGEVVDVLEGDESVVNVIEGHPTLPLAAVSGIDSTVKLFAPARGAAKHSMYRNISSIVRRNARASRRGLQQSATNLQVVRLIMQHQERLRSAVEDGSVVDADMVQCINQ